MIHPLPPPHRPLSPRSERRLRAASAVVVATLLMGGAWVELRALGLLPLGQGDCKSAEPVVQPR